MRGEEFKNKILNSFDGFTKMQAEHLCLFAGGKLAHVTLWQAQRQGAFFRIQHSLDSFWESGLDKDLSFQTLIRERVRQICKVEQLLINMVADKCDATKEKLRKFRKGKRALSGYSSKGKTSDPRFLSSRS